MIPEDVMAEVLKYLTFEDLKHEDVFNWILRIPEKSIFQFIGGTNFDEAIRYIFRDFDNAAGVDDRMRLENLKALMKNENFQLYLEKSKSIMELVFLFPHKPKLVQRLGDEDYSYDFLRWLEIQPDTPEKEFLLANQNDLNSLLSKGCRFLNSTRDYRYHYVLPPAIADIVKQFIRRGDARAADLLNQLMSNTIISQWLSYDCKCGGFRHSIIEMTRSGQSKVFFMDSIFGNWEPKHFQELATNSVRNARVDILNEGLNKLQGIELYNFYDTTVSEITNLACEPGYDITLAKDLITANLQHMKSSPSILDDDETRLHYPSRFRLVLLEHILSRAQNPQLMSLLEFMFAGYHTAGIVIKKVEALAIAARQQNHDYDQYFLHNLHD